MLLLLLFVETQRTMFVSARNRSAQTYEIKWHTDLMKPWGRFTSNWITICCDLHPTVIFSYTPAPPPLPPPTPTSSKQQQQQQNTRFNLIHILSNSLTYLLRDEKWWHFSIPLFIYIIWNIPFSGFWIPSFRLPAFPTYPILTISLSVSRKDNNAGLKCSVSWKKSVIVFLHISKIILLNAQWVKFFAEISKGRLFISIAFFNGQPLLGAFPTDKPSYSCIKEKVTSFTH